MTMPVEVGAVIAGKYRIDRVLGIGGMGVVMAATHLELDERVAIKMMLPEVMHAPQNVERFLREAKNAVKLRSEHICRVLDVSKTEDGTPFIVMEFMEGKDLSEVLAQQGPLPVPDAIDLMLQAIEGIAVAHANQVIHRDLKPQNLFVLTDGDGSPLVKVLDFGISKSSVAGSATKTGELMGSPGYMAPEQMMSTKDVDVRADVWALGVILYQAITGRVPFDAETLPALCMAVIHDQPAPPTTHRPDLPQALDAVVLRCLDKSLQQRYPNVAAFAAALVPFGRPDARVAAERISKMLSRASTPIAAAPAAEVPSPPPQDAPKRFAAVSTLEGSAGSLEAIHTPEPRKRRGLVVGLGAILLIGGAIGSAALIGATRTNTTRAAAGHVVPAEPGPTPPARDATVESPPVSSVEHLSAAAAQAPAPAPAVHVTAPARAIAHKKTNVGQASTTIAAPSTPTQPVSTVPAANPASTEAPVTQAPPPTKSAPADDPLSRRTRGND